MPVLNTADALYVGSDAVEAVYLGLDQVYASGPLIRLTGRTVAETAATGTTVGTLSVINATGTPTFTLTDSAGGKFAITGTTLKTNAALDYETATFHTITVHVTGMTPTVGDRTFIVLVTDVVEPVIVLTGTSIAESASIGAVVGTLSVANAYTGTPVFTLPGSAGGKFAVSGNNLTVAGALDFETAPSHSITVAVSGITPSAANGSFTITVTDVLELDPVIQLTGTTVNEDAAVNTTVGTLSVTGTYTGSPTYALVDSAGGKFNISGALLRVNAALDYETAATHSVTVSVSGLTPAAANKAFTVVVLDVTESASAAWNPSDKDSGITLSGGNLVVTTGTDPSFVGSAARATASASTGKYYCEVTLNVITAGYDPYCGIGCANATKSLTDVAQGGGADPQFIMNFDGSVYDYTTGAPLGTLAACPVGSTVGMAVDLDNRRVWFRVITGGTAGNWNNSGTANPATNTGGLTINALMNGVTFFPYVNHARSSATTSHVTTANFGATTYAASAPSGFSNWGGGGAVGTTKNIVTDYGAVGDAQWAQATLSITTNVLTSATAIWPSATLGSEYIGKWIVVGKAGSHPTIPEAGGGTMLRTTITGWTNSSTITLGANCTLPLSSEPDVIVSWATTNNGESIAEHHGSVDGAFTRFRNDFQGQTVTLTIPAGNYLISSGNFEAVFGGIRNITVNAAGATLCGGAFSLGSWGQQGGGTHHGYTASVSAGATSVTLLTPSEVSRFFVGQYAMMTGFGLQIGGYPTNHQLFEYLKIAAIDSDTGSPTYGKITFVTPLVNAYLSTWPLFYGPPGDLTSGGPATLYAMDPRFDHTTVINNLTIAHHAQSGVSGLNVTMNSCVFESIFGPHATMLQNIVFNNCLGVECSMEVDKIVTSATFNGCDWNALRFQSTCITNCILDNTDIRLSVTGTPWKLTIRNGSTVGTISGIGVISPGCDYGYANELIVSDSQIRYFGAVTTHESGYLIPGKNGSGNGVNVDWGMSSGVITIPLGAVLSGGEIYTALWPVTNGRVFLRDSATGEKIGSFRITNVVQSGSDALVTTTMSGTWPSRSGHKLSFVMHPAPICTFTSVTGCPEVVDLSNSGAAGLPLYSYSKRTYDGSVAAGEYWQVWGRVKKIVVIVTQVADGTTFPGAVTLALNVSVSGMIKMSDYSNTTWAPTIDLKRLGTRTFDATAGTYPVSSWSNTATAHADALPGMTEALWAPGNFRPSMTDTSAAAAGLRPIFSIEVITDQGF
ncbi:MAG: hypothetical protein EHM23_00050 [Acidobacteria bacterium]|nr:MAG: hypothetical protein EHM23_00050 [Acidobacteriota bacterium]